MHPAGGAFMNLAKYAPVCLGLGIDFPAAKITEILFCGRS